MDSIDEKIIKQMILLLQSFKHIIKLIESGCSSALFMVLYINKRNELIKYIVRL